jgi:26S proteasome regulatory subunit N12
MMQRKCLSTSSPLLSGTSSYPIHRRYPIPPSERQYPILGLNLLHLLAANRLAEFHTELELIPIEMHKNIYIKHPIQLEQYLMEGAYNKLWNARADVPADTYTFFMDILMDTVRSEIAECSEKAYKSLSVSEAQKSLLFSSPNDLVEFAKKVRFPSSATLK